jgi:hypothetical protein
MTFSSAWWAVALFSVLYVGPAEHSNFSGYWQLDKSKSQLEANSNTEAFWMKVEQTDSTLIVNVRSFPRNRAEENQTFVYTIGSADNRNTMHGAPMKSDVRFTDDALTYHSLAMFGKDALRMDDAWRLSGDGSVLTFREDSQFAEEPERHVTYVMARRTAKDWPEDTSSQPAEKQFRNIQVLKGIPASQLTVTMAGFTRALGVTCAHCHVSGQFELDTLPTKQVARKMLTMTNQMNAENFSAAAPVTCWTCHRGALTPESVPK